MGDFMKTTICLIRHGQTEWNKNSLIQGRKNIPLNETGINQAHETGKLLNTIDKSWDIFVSSPLSRAIDTANIIKKEIGFDKDIIIIDDLIEREFGSAEGEKIEPNIYARIEVDDILGMETRKELQSRTLNAVLNLANMYPGKKILVATHSHFIKGLLTYLDSKYTFYDTKISNAALNYFIVENNKIIDYKLNVK